MKKKTDNIPLRTLKVGTQFTHVPLGRFRVDRAPRKRAYRCKECAFFNADLCCSGPLARDRGACSETDREDKINVVFTKIV